MTRACHAPMRAAEGLDVPTPKNGDPDTLAEAIRSAAFCLIDGGA